jgi:hypothetical protein
MARGAGRGSDTRQAIAHLAARLIAEDGIEDYAAAKRKAARQAGAADIRELPDNDEIDAALKVYRELYQRDHPAQLRELREIALEVMDELAAYHPYLTGSVLTGSAGKYAGIFLQLYTDESKGVEHYLLNRGIEFELSDTRLYAGDRELRLTMLSFDRAGVEIHLTVLSPRELRTQLKTTRAGKAVERAKRDAVYKLLESD